MALRISLRSSVPHAKLPPSEILSTNHRKLSSVKALVLGYFELLRLPIIFSYESCIKRLSFPSKAGSTTPLCVSASLRMTRQEEASFRSCLPIVEPKDLMNISKEHLPIWWMLKKEIIT